MSFQGYQSQKKLNQPLTLAGVSTKTDTSKYATLQQNYSDKVAVDTNSGGYYRISAVKSVTAADTTYPKRIFTCTSHGAAVNDMIRFEPGSANPGFEATIIQVPDANTIVLGSETPNAMVAANQFYILRAVTQRLADDGTPIVTTSTAPIQFRLNGSATEVSQDTATPANSVPLPVQYLNTIGVRTNLSTLAEQQTQTTALAAIQTAVQIMDDWDESDRAKVNPIVGQAGLQGGSGAVSANTLRVSPATDVNAPMNITQIAGNAVAAGSGVNGTGVQRVTIATDQAAIAVTPAANSSVNVTQLAGVSITLGAGAVTAGTQRVTLATDLNVPTNIAQLGGSNIDLGAANIGSATQRVVIASNQSAVAGNITQLGTQTIALGQGQVTAGTLRVVQATEDTATLTSQTDQATSVQLMASNSSRQMATFFNDSTESLYLKFGTTASATSFNVKIAPGGYFELPGPTVFTGRIDGIWSANGSGSVYMAEW